MGAVYENINFNFQSITGSMNHAGWNKNDLSTLDGHSVANKLNFGIASWY